MTEWTVITSKKPLSRGRWFLQARLPAHCAPPLLLACAAWVMCIAMAATSQAGDETVYRSIRASQHVRVDERTLPEKGVRGGHSGWEVRTRRFVVFSTVSPQQAVTAAERLEAAWGDVGRLADRWTAVHHQPTFGIGAVGVILTDRPVHAQPSPVTGPGPLREDATILVDLGRQRDLEKLGPELRREVFLAFLRVAQQDHVLPEWVKSGLADYVADKKQFEPSAGALSRLPAAWPAASTRSVRDRVELPPEDRTRSALWVRYLLEGEDAEHAPQFFKAMAETVRARPEAEAPLADRFRTAVQANARFASGPPFRGHDPLDGLAARASATGWPDKWATDPDVGQPLVRTEPKDMPLGPEHREMVFILKIARRFGAPRAPSIHPRVIENGVDRTQERIGPAPGPQPLDLAALHRQLSEPNQAPWATLDPDGGLVFYGDSGPVERILADAPRRYRVTFRKGRSVLERTFDSGEVVEAWLEENLENPDRPLVHLASRAPAPIKQKTVPASIASPPAEKGETTPPAKS